jgi:hypothetical protein
MALFNLALSVILGPESKCLTLYATYVIHDAQKGGFLS